MPPQSIDPRCMVSNRSTVSKETKGPGLSLYRARRSLTLTRVERVRDVCLTKPTSERCGRRRTLISEWSRTESSQAIWGTCALAGVAKANDKVQLILNDV
ncbi:hypothetical protein NEOLEDRAFT_59799 [Neolentinus lepideus HHB14362 ss-1]|uniref:Uncharacterized protein n=1 Tax=Neolentinus lepideus HHB14362 ss-1 TaxID=1314782 RepID=A0A165U7Z0_9AGAM|nr:hypothetical protein NEOLEDRAFT_59799 [Neolentinus lepideus HHB14362 ss-1]